MFDTRDSQFIWEYMYEGLFIEVFSKLDYLYFTATLDDSRHILYELKISDLKRDPILSDELKNKLLEHLKC